MGRGVLLFWPKGYLNSDLRPTMVIGLKLALGHTRASGSNVLKTLFQISFFVNQSNSCFHTKTVDIL
jgi:hypothetical protein